MSAKVRILKALPAGRRSVRTKSRTPKPGTQYYFRDCAVLSNRMSGLSNFFRWRDAAPVEIRAVGPGEIEPALRLILGSGGGRADSAAAAEFEVFAQQRQIDLTSICVAASGHRLLAACLAIESPGRTALLMSSTAGASHALAQHVARCIESATAELMSPRRGIQLIQILLEEPEHKLGQELQRLGFVEVATLIYLQRRVNRPPARPTLPEGWALVHYTPDTHDLFAAAITASYEHSLDCPVLHNRRDIDDVIAGHRATGEYDPALWFCLVENGQPRGVLLLAKVPGHDALELVYLGLAPAARGRRLGDALLQLALHEVGDRHLSQLTLAVDEQNVPAIRLYHRHGLAEVHRRVAMMKMA